jgi:protein-tyrosine-phosphatase
MAEAMFKAILPEDLLRSISVSSAGTHAADGLPAELNAVRAMQELCADLSGHRSRMVVPEWVADADLVLVMERLHAIQIRDFADIRETEIRLLGEFGGQTKNGEIQDPYGGDLARYRKTALQIRGCLDGVIQHVRQCLPT